MAYEHEMFYASDVEKIIGVKRTRLHSWIERGWLKPSIQKGAGSGSRNIFNRMDLYKIGMFKNLISLGLPRKMIALCFQSIADLYPPFESWRIDGDEIEFLVWGVEEEGDRVSPYLILSGSLEVPVDIFLHRGFSKKQPFMDSIFMFNFRRVKEKIDSKIKEIKS